MVAAHVVLWRHGRTAWNAEGRLQGQSDIELDAVGLAQVQKAAPTLAEAFPNALVVSSDLKRAAASAQKYADLTQSEVHYDPRLRERSFGVWEGLSRAEIAAKWPDLFEAWQRGSDALASPPMGESRGAASKRVADAIVEWANKTPDGDTLLVVSHGAAITGAITYLIGQDPDAWHGVSGMDNANWSVLRPPHPLSHLPTEQTQTSSQPTKDDAAQGRGRVVQGRGSATQAHGNVANDQSNQDPAAHLAQTAWRLAAHNVGHTPPSEIYNG